MGMATLEKERDARMEGAGSPSSSSARPSAPLRVSSAKDLRRCESISSTMSPIALLRAALVKEVQHLQYLTCASYGVDCPPHNFGSSEVL